MVGDHKWAVLIGPEFSPVGSSLDTVFTVSMTRLHSEMTWVKAAKRLRVPTFFLAWCLNPLTTGIGTLPIEDPEG